MIERPRITCCVPFCRRTTDKPWAEWICAKHWRTTNPEVRKQRRKLIKAGKKRLADKKWEWLKRQAIEKSAGL